MNTELEATDPKDLEFVKLNQLERPQRTFFYQRRDGDGDVVEDSEIFACHEQEAGLFGKFHKLIGVGDGTTYFNYVKSHMPKKGELISINKAQEILKEAFAAELAVARGNKTRPKYNNVHFDTTILNHPNAQKIIDNFNPL